MRASSKDFQLPAQSEIEYFRSKLLEWYCASGRNFTWREKRIPIYQKVIAEVLLQRSRAETIAAFYPAFITRFPSWASLASTTEEEIAEFLKPIGLWRRRASSLLKLATEMKRRNGKFPRTRGEIETLPGVGQYIANAVLMFVHGEPQPLLDVNMARVLERYFKPRTLADIRYEELGRTIAALDVIIDNR
jgi:A/G-specific adenine glycosylase